MATKKAGAKPATVKASAQKKVGNKKPVAPTEQATPSAPQEKKPVTSKKTDPAQVKKAVPAEGKKISVTTSTGTYPATVIAVHGGNRVDAVLIPETGQPQTLGTVSHISDTDKLPYWNESV